ncbi:MAG: MBL fold metallo-hydrolase [Candidatus Marsarchaeota archaeon]|jgi:predicted metal-dependent RNase|nr:MBL fold metallo-hydrolase [Candidatus Marsarchaeota archaeon]
MEISFLGAAGEVGRSCILIESKNTKILLDAGVKLGPKIEYPELKDEMLKEIDATVISHAHLDHCGYLTHMYSRGYTAPTYATKPTIEMMQVLLSDYIRVSQARDVHKNVVSKIMNSSRMLEFKQEVRIKDLTVSLIPSGHILGSALIRVSDGKESVIYTGDINLSKTKLLNFADLRALEADALIMESTNGGEDDIMKTEKENIQTLTNIIKGTILGGGKVIIPSFAVGRAQEVLLILDDYMNSGTIPKTPIYMDGMLNKILRIHRHNVIYCRRELQTRILMSDSDPFKSENFIPVESKNSRNKIAHSPDSSIIVTTSGMLTGGPVLFYLSKLGRDKMNTMIFVGFQAEGTPGRAIKDGEREIEIDGKKVHLSLDVKYVRLSGHADRKQLESIPTKISGLKKIFLVHGELSKAESLKKELSKHFEVHIPTLGSRHRV